jgi:hypothetical protein
MLGATISGICFCLLCALPLDAANPSDIKFSVRLVKDSQVYQMGERIELEISYSSSAVEKYMTNRVTPNPDVGGVNPHPSPAEGVIDLSELRRDPGGGTAGSIPGGPAFLESQPITQQFDLTEWYRFAKPGHYSVSVSSGAVVRMRSAEEGGGPENLTLESNAVSLDVLAANPSWEAAELTNIMEAVAAAKYPGQLMLLAHRLAMLDTPAALKELVSLFLASSDDSSGLATYEGLRESSHTDLVISLLQAAMADPVTNIPSRFPNLLAEMQTREELGIPPPYPADPAEYPAWDQKIKERNKVRDKYLATADAQLLASAEHRTGPQRAEAIYLAWSGVAYINLRNPQLAELLSHLQQAVFDVESELNPWERSEFVTSAWQTMPHELLLPIIRDLAAGNGSGPGFTASQAFRLWCEDWPTDCSTEIIRRASESDPRINQHIVFMIPEADHPELDKMLEEKLADPMLVWRGAASANFSALVLRAGSRNLVPAVDATLDRLAVSTRKDCEPQAYLIGYLFRFSKEDAGKRLSAIMQGASDECASQMFPFLDKSRYSDEQVSIAVRALDSPNLAAAASSALFLAVHAPEAAKAALWRRLDALWSDWRDRKAELQDAPFPFSPVSSAPAHAAELERSLASALVNGTSWKLSQAEREHLRSGCLTDQCRNIADGKMSLSM